MGLGQSISELIRPIAGVFQIPLFTPHSRLNMELLHFVCLFPKSSESFALFVFNHLVYFIFNHLVSFFFDHLVPFFFNHLVPFFDEHLVSFFFNHLVSFFLCCFRWSHTLRSRSSHRLFQREPSSRPWQCRSTTTRWWTRSARMQTFYRRL